MGGYVQETALECERRETLLIKPLIIQFLPHLGGVILDGNEFHQFFAPRKNCLFASFLDEPSVQMFEKRLNPNGFYELFNDDYLAIRKLDVVNRQE